MPANTTLQDVANGAGVHRSTVSLALRDHPRIPAATRRRIQSLARRLGYRLNPLVAALMKSRRTGKPAKHAAIAYVTNYPTRYGWRPPHHDRPDFFPGAAERARDFGYKLEHFWLAEPGMSPPRFCDILTARGIHGLLLGRLPPGQHELDLAWERFSCVALGLTLRSPSLHHVAENHFDTAWQAMTQCRARGYQRMGFVFCAPDDSPRVFDRWMGAYLRQQLQLAPEHRVPPCLFEGGVPPQDAFRAWFKYWRPDALIATHAEPVMAWLRAVGRHVPRDVGLVTLDNHFEHGVAGVLHDPAKLGALAAEMLVGLLHRGETGVPIDPHEVLLTGGWSEGRLLPSRLRSKPALPS